MSSGTYYTNYGYHYPQPPCIKSIILCIRPPALLQIDGDLGVAHPVIELRSELGRGGIVLSELVLVVYAAACRGVGQMVPAEGVGRHSEEVGCSAHYVGPPERE